MGSSKGQISFLLRLLQWRHLHLIWRSFSFSFASRVAEASNFPPDFVGLQWLCFYRKQSAAGCSVLLLPSWPLDYPYAYVDYPMSAPGPITGLPSSRARMNCGTIFGIFVRSSLALSGSQLCSGIGPPCHAFFIVHEDRSLHLSRQTC